MQTFLLYYAVSVALTWLLIRLGFHFDTTNGAEDDKTIRFWAIIMIIPFYNIPRITYTLLKMWNKRPDGSSKAGAFFQHFLRYLLVGNQK